MNHVNRPLRVGVGVGGVGVVAHLVATFLLFVVPSFLLGPTTRGPFIETWFSPVATASGVVLVYGTPLLAGLAGYALLRDANGDAADVLAGLLLGGLVFGVGVATIDWAVSAPQLAGDAGQYVRQALRFAARLVGAGSFGALCGIAHRGS